MSMMRSFFSHYGILSISLITMTIFGQFGLRPSQTKHKCLAYFLDIFFFCSYTAFCTAILWSLGMTIIFSPSNLDLNQMTTLYPSLYNIITLTMFTIWLVLTFKKYNIFCLLEDVVAIRRATLGKTYRFCVIVTIGMVAAIFITNEVLNTILAISQLDIFTIILKLVFSNITWMLIWNITFLLCVIALIISREFQKCISDLKNTISDDETLCSDLFFKTEERFRELSSVVNKVDSMFSLPVSIILTMSLSTLCVSIYAMAIGDDPRHWSIAPMYSALSLGFSLFSLSGLNYWVRNLTDNL